MAEIKAVAPSWLSSKIHLWCDGYLPGRKRRSLFRVSLCGAGRVGDDAVLATIAEAVADCWTDRRPSPQDPRPAWSWCRNCIGHALHVAGLTHVAVDHLARFTVPTEETNR